MDSFKLLFVLPDRKNCKVLAIKKGNKFCFPIYDKPVEENVGFDEPQLYNDFFREITGISIFRRYTFNTQTYVVFVFEEIDNINATPSSEYEWVTYNEFIDTQRNDDFREIACSVRLNYNKSMNMPWVSTDGFLPYLTWLHDVCASKKINIRNPIKQVKNAYVSTVFCVPTDIGNLYLKIPGKVYISELLFTHELMKFGIAEFPVWVSFNLEMNVVLMKDMGGKDLPSESDVETLKKVVVRYSQIQKDSIKYIQSIDCYSNDYRIDTVLGELYDFPRKSFEILNGTKYEITQDEMNRLERNVGSARPLLKSVIGKQIPNTIQHGDVRPGNIRVVGENYIFYDWSWGAVSHPFIEISLFLNVIRRSLPADVHAKAILVDTYLREWLEYGTYEELKNTFTILDDLKELFMAYSDYCWVKAICSASIENLDIMSADGWLLTRRNYYYAKVLKRFIEKTF